MPSRHRARFLFLGFAGLAAASGCAQILGVDRDYQDVGELGGSAGESGSAGATGGSTNGLGGVSAGARSDGGTSGSSGQSSEGLGGAGHGGQSGGSGNAGQSGHVSAGGSEEGGAGAAGCGGTSTTLCGISCVDISQDASHCGTCEQTCSGTTAQCVHGACVACAHDADCPAANCRTTTCSSEHTCDSLPADVGSPCALAKTVSGVCDAQMVCVACLGAEKSCVDNAPESCVNEAWIVSATCAGPTEPAGTPSPVCSAGSCRTVTALAAGDGFTCALLGDGTVRCWGKNDQGQLGTGTSTPPNATPTQVILASTVTAITAGTSHVCVLTAEQTVVCWGASGSGQTGVVSPLPAAPAQVPGLGPSATSVVAGDTHTCALLGHVVWCWGANDSSQIETPSSATTPPVQPNGQPTASVLALGSGFTCILHTGGDTVTCWGRNDVGQLGIGTAGAPVPPPQPASASVPLDGAVASLGASGSHACIAGAQGLEKSGVYCWGGNSAGELGTGTVINESSATKAKTSAVSFFQTLVQDVVLGPVDTLLFVGQDASSTSLVVWGDNTYGQLELGSTTTPQSLPVTAISLAETEPTAVGSTHMCHRWTHPDIGPPNVFCVGDNTFGQLGTAAGPASTTPVGVVW